MSTSFYVYETQAEPKADIGMSEKLKRCEACNDPVLWDDMVVIVNDELYHKDCVLLVPTGYFAMLGENPLRETENEDGQIAYSILNDGEFLEDEE